MRRRLIGLVTLGLTVSLLVLGLASCGGGDDDTSSSAAETTQSGDETQPAGGGEPSGEPIKVQFLTSYDNPILDWSMGYHGAEAAADAINAAGGIDGRPVQIIPCNDAVDPNKAARCAREAVSQGAVATIVDSLFTAQIFPIIGEAEIPAVGGFVTEPIDSQAKMAYPIFPGTNLINQAFPAVLKEQGKKSMSAIVEGRAATVTDVGVMEDGAEATGLEFKGAVGVPGEATDLSPKIQELTDLGADATVALLARPLLTGVLSSAQELSFEEPFATTAWTVFPSMLEEIGPAAESLLTLDQLPPASAGDQIPAVAQFNEELEAAGKDAPDDRSEVGMQGWFALHAIALAAERIEGEIDNRSLVASLDSGEPIDLLGLLEWTPGAKGPGVFDRLSNGELYQAEVQDGELVLLDPEPVDGFALAGLE